MISFKGKEYHLVCNMYVLLQFCKRINENSLTSALKRLSSMGGADGIKVDGLESWSAILYEMLLQGAKVNGTDLDITYEDCFETVLDTELVEEATKVILDSLPNENGARQFKKKATKPKAVRT